MADFLGYVQYAVQFMLIQFRMQHVLVNLHAHQSLLKMQPLKGRASDGQCCVRFHKGKTAMPAASEPIEASL
jgi:hypothetical protein